MTKLFIHIGTWKTGSSTIQYNLYKLRSELERERYFYLCKENKMVVDDGIIKTYTGVNDDFVQQSRERFKKILDEQRRKNSEINFISSAEEFSGNPLDGFKNARAVARNLFEITKDLDFEIYIIVYLRRQDDFLESMYTNTVHLGRSDSFQDFIKQFDNSHFNWYTLVEAYAELFGEKNIIVKRYHKSFLPNKDSLIQSFGDAIGSAFLKEYTGTVPRNRGLSRDALEIARITNRSFNKEEQYQLKNIFQDVNSKKPFEKYSFFDFQERTEILDRYKESNRKVFQKYISEEKDSLFPEPIESAEYKQYDGLDLEAVVTNLSRAILVVERRAKENDKKIFRELRNKFLKFRLRQRIMSLLNQFPYIKSFLKSFLK